MYKTFKEFHDLKTEGIIKWISNFFRKGKDPEEDAYFSKLQAQPSSTLSINQWVFKDYMQQLMRLLPNLPDFSKMPAEQRRVLVRNWLFSQPIFNDRGKLHQAFETASKALGAANQMGFTDAYARLHDLVTAMKDKLEQVKFRPMPTGWEGGEVRKHPTTSHAPGHFQRAMGMADRKRTIIQASNSDMSDADLIKVLMIQHGVKGERAARAMITKVRREYSQM